MKKNFLFGALAVLLAGFWFGGTSLASTPAVARVGNSECTTVEETDCYASLADAVAYADTGAIITLLANDENSFTSDLMLIIRKELTIDGQNLYYIKGLEDGSGLHFIGITGTGDVTIKNVTIKNFGNNSNVLSPNTEPIMVSTIYEGKLTLENVTIESFNNRAVVIGGGSFDINGLTINGDENSTHGQQGIEIHTTTEGNTIKNTVINNVKNHSDSTHFFGIMYDGNGSVEVTNTKINGAGAVVIASPTNGLSFTESNGTITLGAGNEFETNDDVLAIQQMGDPAIHSSTSTIKVTGGTYSGSISKSDHASVSGAKFEISDGTFSEPVLKEFITDNKCTVKNTDGTYGIGACPISSIVDDKLYNTPGVSPDVTISQNGYNITVNGAVNYYNKAANNGNGYRYGLEIIPDEAITDEMIANYATFSLSGAHWAAGAISGVSYSGEVITNDPGFHNPTRSLYVYPKLSGDKLEITLNWGPYYGTETFVVDHSAATLKPGITVTFDTDGGDAIADLVFSGTDLEGGINSNIKVGDITGSKEGYTFLNWSLSGSDTPYDTTSVIETDIALKANYTGNEISLTFSVDGTDTVLTGKAGDPFVTAPTLSKSCYNGSWSPALPNTIPAVDTKYTAQWSYNCGSSGGGGTKTTTTDTKTTEDTDKVDETKADETKVDETKPEEQKAPMTEDEAIAKYGQEQIDAYKWALQNGITTMETVEDARLGDTLTRAELAKMMVVYIAKVLGKQPVVTGSATYDDVNNGLGDLAGYIQLAYQYQIMGIDAKGNPIKSFNPNGKVTRGEYATVFSRVLFGSLFNKEGADFYTDHLKALKAAGILSNTEPTIQEVRGWVLLMMYRSSKNIDKIAEVTAAVEASQEEVAEAEAKAEEAATEEAPAAEASTGDTEEAPAAEASTGDTAEAPAAEASTGDTAEAPAAEASTGDVASN